MIRDRLIVATLDKVDGGSTMVTVAATPTRMVDTKQAVSVGYIELIGQRLVWRATSTEYCI